MKTAAKTVEAVYGVVPRLRERDGGSWPSRGHANGSVHARGWRTYYGYSYRPESVVTVAGEARDKFSGAAVAAAMIAHAERGTIVPHEPREFEKLAASLAGVPMKRVSSATPAPMREKTPAERMAASEAVILRKPQEVAGPRADMLCPVCGSVLSAVTLTCNNPRCGKTAPKKAAAEPVVETVPAPVVIAEQVAEVLPAAVAAPMGEQSNRFIDAAAVLREMAAGYGPRRAHKLVAMADFVESHAKRVA